MRKQPLYHVSMMRPGVMIELHEMECLKDAYTEEEEKMWDDIYAEVVDISESGFTIDYEDCGWKLVVRGYGDDEFAETYTYFVPTDTLIKVIDGHNAMYWIVKEMV